MFNRLDMKIAQSERPAPVCDHPKFERVLGAAFEKTQSVKPIPARNK